MRPLAATTRTLERAATLPLGLVLALAAAEPAAAQVRCGDVIGPNVKITLGRNLDNCPPGPPALTIVGPATVDLGGFSVICRPAGDDTARGIVLVGRRATLRNGSVQLCAVGVQALGEGSHRIDLVTVATSDGGSAGSGDGFRIESAGNRIGESAAVQNRGIGFAIFGSGTRLVGNGAFFNDVGYLLSFGQRNSLKGNDAVRNQRDGFRLTNGIRNSLTGNQSIENGMGFSTSDESRLRFTGNVALRNREDGMSLFFGMANRLTGNRFEDNGEHGLVLGAARETVVTRNTSLNNDRMNVSPPRFDMVDFGAAGCGTNRWLRNVFVTADPPSCIR